MPWDWVIYQSAYGVQGLNSEWWKEHFEVPCLSTTTDRAAETIIEEIDGQVHGSMAASSSTLSSHTRKGGKGTGGQDAGGQPPPRPDRVKNVCNNWNNNSGSCAGNVATCPQGREHVCRICFSPKHRGKDHRSSTYWKQEWVQKEPKLTKNQRRKANAAKRAANTEG